MRHSKNSRATYRGFTLIELLTVIAIIGILAAIIIPTVSKVRDTARKSECVSKLRQWGSAVRLMANDRKGVVPLWNGLGSDQGIYSDYFGSKKMVNAAGQQAWSQEVMSRCPSDFIVDKADTEYRSRSYTFGRPTLGAGASKVKKLDPTSFGMAAGSSLSGYNLSAATTPSQLLLMVESHSLGGDNAYTVDDPDQGWGQHVVPMQVNTDSRLVRHSSITNILFLDGHVSGFSRAKTDYNNPANRLTMMRWFSLE
jgi:prepilin-type N-terminal cleavage/methylation domain-containing protein/prepilin-type processing-associated H-X9-DG protein